MRIEITHETDWSAECTVLDDGDVVIASVRVEGKAIPLRWLPQTIDRLLCAAAREAEAQNRRDSAAEQADLKILRRKEGERP